MKHIRLFTIAWTLLLLGPWPISLGPTALATPNVIFILADDLGYGDLGCYGQQKIQTPRLDAMAAGGIRFTQFYAGATVCAPSRSVLMTGRHTGHTRVRGNAEAERQTLLDEDFTVAELFKKSGYATALIGKWGLGQEGFPGHPNRQGFDHFFGYLNQHHAHNYYPEFLWRNDRLVWLDNDVQRIGPRADFRGGYALKRVDYSHDLFAADALSWIESHKDQSFFLYLALTIPHANNEGTRPTGNGQEVPDYGPYADLDWTEPNKGQAAMITRMDRDVGRILDKLRELGIAEKTLVIFSSDNGPHREGGNDPEFFDANGPLRGMKRHLYEGGIRVPTIAYWPGTIEPGRTSDHIAYFGDFFATAADLLGIDAPPGLDSISFAPTLRGQSDKQQQHAYLYWEFYEGRGARAVRFDLYNKAVRPQWNAPIELYDLRSDLGEENDIAAQHPDLVARAESYMVDAHTPDANWNPPGSR